MSLISSCVINRNFPCILSLQNGTILFLTSNNENGNIRNTQGPDLNVITFKLPGGNTYKACINTTGRILLMATRTDMQVIGLNNRNEMLAFSPFSINPIDPPIENAIIFSNKFSNLFYYVEIDERPSVVRFSESTNFCYTVSKGIID